MMVDFDFGSSKSSFSGSNSAALRISAKDFEASTLMASKVGLLAPGKNRKVKLIAVLFSEMWSGYLMIDMALGSRKENRESELNKK